MATGTILAVASLAATAIGVVGTIMQGQAQQDVAEAQADQEEFKAQQARLRAAQEETRRRRLAAREIGSAIANAAANNVAIDFQSGSFAGIVKSNEKDTERDIKRIRLFGLSEAGAAETSAITRRAQGRNAVRASLFNAGATAFSGVSDLEQTGIFGR